MKLSFSLNKVKSAPVTSSLKPPPIFSSGDDEEYVDTASIPLSVDGDTAVNKKILAQNIESSKSMKKRMEAEKKIDETVYEYDEVWDRMQEAKRRQKEAKEMDTKERKPKYIHNLLNSAATRKLDYLRAEEKMMQLERAAEGDEFKDKEAFVTQAYKDQMAEVRRAEEEEKRREEQQRKTGGGSSGMTHFYRKMLEESEQRHEAAVAATHQRIIGPQNLVSNLTITKPADFTPVSDLELARVAREQGKDVELNDDNQIVDKRDLLSAGLNLSAPNTRRLGLRPSIKQHAITTEDNAVQSHRAVGTAASRREINERRTREIQQQMQDEENRAASEKRRIEDDAIRRIVVKRNNDDDVQSARTRYLQRKRQRTEETQNQTP